MIVIPGLSQPLKAAGKHITSRNEESGGLMVQADSAVQRAACPRCSKRSSRLHGCYQRSIADSPCFGRPVTLAVEIRRFKCVNRRCPQRTFSERIDPLAVARQRRTLRLMQAVRALGYALGGEAAARLAEQLGMPVSGPTVLRELRRADCPPPEASPVVVGIDDWVIARGHRYGTIMVDLKRRCPIELVEGPEDKAFKRPFPCPWGGQTGQTRPDRPVEALIAIFVDDGGPSSAGEFGSAGPSDGSSMRLPCRSGRFAPVLIPRAQPVSRPPGGGQLERQ